MGRPGKRAELFKKYNELEELVKEKAVTFAQLNKCSEDEKIQDEVVNGLKDSRKIYEDEEKEILKRKEKINLKIIKIKDKEIEYKSEDIQIFPEKIDDVLDNYEQYKDNFENRMKKNELDEVLKVYKEKREQGIQKKSEHQDVVDNRYYPENVDAIFTQSEAQKALTIEMLNKKMKDKTFSLDEIKNLKEAAENAKTEYDNKKKEMDKWLEEENTKHGISSDLLEKNKFEAMNDKAKKDIMKSQLDSLLTNAKNQDIPSIEYYWIEEQNLKNFKEDVETESNSIIFKASENIENVKTQEDEALIRNAIKFYYHNETGEAFESGKDDAVLNDYNKAKDDLDVLLRRKEIAKASITAYKGQKNIKLEKEDYRKFIPQKAIIEQYGEEMGDKIRNGLESFVNAEDEKKSIIEKFYELEGSIDNEKIPETFTDLGKLKGAEYELACIRINKILANTPKDGIFDEITKTRTTVKSLDEYFAMTNKKDLTDDEKKVMVAKKYVIKKLIKESNETNKENKVIIKNEKEIEKLKQDLKNAIAKEDAADKDIQNALKEYKSIGEKKLKEEEKNIDEKIKTAQETLEAKKNNIKTIVEGAKNIQKRNVEDAKTKYEGNKIIHEVHKEKIENLIKQNNKIKSDHSNEDKAKLKELEKTADTAKKEQEKAENEINVILKETNKEIGKSKAYKELMKSEDKEFNTDKKAEDEKQNERRKTIENAIKQDNKNAEKLYEQINEQISDDMKKSRKDAKKEYLFKSVKKVKDSALNSVFGTFSKTIYEALETFETAKFYGENETRLQIIKENEEEIEKNNITLQSIEGKKNEYRKKIMEYKQNEEEYKKDEEKEKEYTENSKKYAELEKQSKVIRDSTQERTERINDLNKICENFEINKSAMIQERKEEIRNEFEKYYESTVVHEEKITLAKIEAIKEASEGNQELSIMADEKINLEKEDIETMKEEVDKYRKEKDEQIDKINEVSENIASILTENNLSKMETAIKGIVFVANLVIDRINKKNEDGNKENEENKKDEQPIEKIDLQATMENVDKSLGSESYSYIDSGVRLLRKINETIIKPYAKEFNDDYKATLKEHDISKIRLNAVLADEEEFKKYSANVSLESQKTLLDAKLEMDNANIENLLENNKAERELINNAITKAEEKKSKMSEAVNEAKNKNIAKAEQIKDKLNEIDNMNKAFNKEFVDTVKAADEEDKKNKPVVLDKEDVIKTRENDTDFSFLSKLTGVEMNQNSEMADVLDAMSNVYINGINACAYFDLQGKYINALRADDKEAAKQDFMKQVLECGDSIQDCFKAPFDKDVKGPLVGQIISVENDSMLLSAVTLKSDLESDKAAVSEFNKINKLINSDFNEMRVEVAKNALDKEREQKRAERMAQKEKGKDMDKDDLLAKAVFKSRDMSFGK